jgi:hypothetical protein
VDLKQRVKRSPREAPVIVDELMLNAIEDALAFKAYFANGDSALEANVDVVSASARGYLPPFLWGRAPRAPQQQSLGARVPQGGRRAAPAAAGSQGWGSLDGASGAARHLGRGL